MPYGVKRLRCRQGPLTSRRATGRNGPCGCPVGVMSSRAATPEWRRLDLNPESLGQKQDEERVKHWAFGAFFCVGSPFLGRVCSCVSGGQTRRQTDVFGDETVFRLIRIGYANRGTYRQKRLYNSWGGVGGGGGDDRMISLQSI